MTDRLMTLIINPSPAADWSQAFARQQNVESVPQQAALWQQNEQWGTHKLSCSPESSAIKRENPRRKILLAAIKLQISLPARLMQKKYIKIYQGCNILLSQAGLDLKW